MRSTACRANFLISKCNKVPFPFTSVIRDVLYVKLYFMIVITFSHALHYID